MAELSRFGGAQPVSPRDAGALFAISSAAAPWLVVDGGVDFSLVSDRSLSLFAGLTLSPAHL